MTPKRFVDLVLCMTAEPARLWVSSSMRNGPLNLLGLFKLLYSVSPGSYGNFEIMPLLCPGGFDTCTTTLAARERYRMNDTDGIYLRFLPPPLKTSLTLIPCNQMRILVTFLKLWIMTSKWKLLRLVVQAWNDSHFRKARNHTSYSTLPMIFRGHLRGELWTSSRQAVGSSWVVNGVRGNSSNLSSRKFDSPDFIPIFF